MEKLQDSLLPNVRVLRAIGLWNRSGTFEYGLLSLTLLVPFLFVHNLTLTIHIYVIFGNIEEMAACAFVLLMKTVAIFKTYYFLKDFDSIQSLMTSLDRKEFLPENAKQKAIVAGTLKLWKITYYTFFVGTGVTLCFWGLYPVMDGSVRQYRLPFSAWYPYDYKIHGRYEATYAFQVVSSVYIAAINVSLDGFYSGLMAHVSAQCQILKNSILEEFPSHLTDEQAKETLVKWIVHYKNIIEFSDDLREFLNIVAFSQLVSSVIIICMTMLHLTLVEAFSPEFFTLVIYMFCVFVQILTYCWYGDEVVSKVGNPYYICYTTILKTHKKFDFDSSDLPMAAFNCDWVDRPITFKKDLMFFINRTQTPIKMYALGFFTLSVETFMQIMRTSWSYFVLLRQLHTEQI